MSQESAGNNSPRPRERNIQVAVRVRPLNEREVGEGHRAAWSWDGPNIQQEIFPAWDARSLMAVGRREEEKPFFTFDHLFIPEASTGDVYGAVVEDVVDAAMEGYHASVFAYGQTSTGKTFTMQGTEEEPGVIPRAVHACFEHIETSVDKEFVLRVSYLEIYQEQMHDLLSPATTTLRIMEDSRKGSIIVRNLKEEVVISAEQVFALIAAGEAHRHIGATDFNAYSSRSHTVFRLTIESREKVATAGGKRPRTLVSTLNLVDLAGSENARATKGLSNANGQVRATEGKFINKSLLTLSKIIHKLSAQQGSKDPNASNMHLPFRESKLTRLLQPALRGNAQVTIVCTVTPSDRSIEESLNTLKFASRAKRIRQRVSRNEVVDNSTLLAQYKSEIETLRAELAVAQQIARRASTAGLHASPPSDGSPVPLIDTSSPQRSRSDEDDDYRDIADIQDTIVKLQRLILQGGNNVDQFQASPASMQETPRHQMRNSTPSGRPGSPGNGQPKSFFHRGRGSRRQNQEDVLPSPSASEPDRERSTARRAGLLRSNSSRSSKASGESRVSGEQVNDGERAGRDGESVGMARESTQDETDSEGVPRGKSQLDIIVEKRELRSKGSAPAGELGQRGPEDVREIVSELRSIQAALGGVLDRRKQIRSHSGNGSIQTPRGSSKALQAIAFDPYVYPSPNTFGSVMNGEYRGLKSDEKGNSPKERSPSISSHVSRAGGSHEEVETLRGQLAAKQAESTLTQADSRFLESQLAEKDRLLDELFGMVEEVETAREVLARENEELKLQNAHLQEVLSARETELRELKGVSEEEETF